MSHILRQLEMSRGVVDLLVETGFVVLRCEVDVFRTRPVIWLARSPLCDELRATVSIERTDDGGYLKTRTTDINGCRVQWRCDEP